MGKEVIAEQEKTNYKLYVKLFTNISALKRNAEEVLKVLHRLEVPVTKINRRKNMFLWAEIGKIELRGFKLLRDRHQLIQNSHQPQFIENWQPKQWSHIMNFFTGKHEDSPEMNSQLQVVIMEKIKQKKDEIVFFSEEEILIKSAYALFQSHTKNKFFYHGTSSICLPKIKKYGLVPTMRPWDPHDLQRLDFLLIKAGHESGIGKVYKGQGRISNIISEKNAIYITSDKDGAVFCAHNSPEVFDLLFARKKTIRGLFFQIFQLLANKEYKRFSSERRTYQEWEEYVDPYTCNQRKLREGIKKFGNLPESEIKEAIKLLINFWNIHTQSFPILLTINPWPFTTLSYKKEICQMIDQHAEGTDVNNIINKFTELMERWLDGYNCEINLQITDRISANQILKIERV